MTFNFELTLYLTTRCTYRFSYPVGSKPQSYQLRDELHMTSEEFDSYEPDFQQLNMFERDGFRETFSKADFVKIAESHSCREVAMAKGSFLNNWRCGMNMVYRNSLLVLEYPSQVPDVFKEIVTTALLNVHAVNRVGSALSCDLDSGSFAIAMDPGYWNKAWLSLLTYFTKYGDYLCEICDIRDNSQASLDQTVRAILDSWSGQVGLYTAFGLWAWANEHEQIIHGNYEQSNGIHSAMDYYTALYEPTKLLEFLDEYHLGLDRCSKLFVTNHQYLAQTVGLQVPYWFNQGNNNDDYLAESPEWNDYMGYENEDGEPEDYDDYDDPDDWDFEEDW